MSGHLKHEAQFPASQQVPTWCICGRGSSALTGPEGSLSLFIHLPDFGVFDGKQDEPVVVQVEEGFRVLRHDESMLWNG